jgi:DNA-directed RNA polymerase specialized sigma subunit
MFKRTGKREKSTTSVGHYVRNADLLPAVIEAKQLGRVTDKLIVMIQRIAERYSRKSNFGGYSFREDMVSAAVENLCKNALKFDTEKYSNPFSFYTTAIHNSFLQYMADEKKQRNIRDQLLIDAGASPSYGFSSDSVSEDTAPIESDETLQQRTVVDEELLSAVSSTTAPDAASSTADRIKYRDRAPGEVVTLSAQEVEFDTARGIFVRKVAR